MKIVGNGQFGGERSSNRKRKVRGGDWSTDCQRFEFRNVSSASSAFSSSSLPPCSVLLLLCRLNIGESVRLTQIENRTCKRAFTLFPFFFFFIFFFSSFSFHLERHEFIFLPQCLGGSIDAMKEPMQWILVYFWTLGE